LKTVTALKSSDMKSAFAKAGSIALSYRSPGTHAGDLSIADSKTDVSSSDSQKEATASEEDGAKVAANILDARKKAMEEIEAGRPAPYYFGSSTRSTNSADPAKE
jgi:hypothetical protein